MDQLDLTVSIVAGGRTDLVRDCLDSLFKSLDDSIKYEVILVDNAGAEDLSMLFQERYPGLKIMRNAQRKGFGANHNQVMAISRGRYVFLLNDDTIVSAQACQKLVTAADRHPECGFFGPRLLNADGSLQRSVYRFPSLALRLAECTMVERFAPFVFDSYRYFAHDRESEVEFLSGAALMVRADVFKSVGGFDEGFFMYSEESDWMLRASEQGIRALFVPDSVITHLGGQSTNNLSAERSVEFLRSHERLIANHHGAPYMLAYRLATFAKHLPRSIALNITAPGSERALCETDALLWSIGQLKRPGLSEALLGKKV